MRQNFYVTECPVYGLLTIYLLTGMSSIRLGEADDWSRLHLMMPDVPWYSTIDRRNSPIAACGIREAAL